MQGIGIGIVAVDLRQEVKMIRGSVGVNCSGDLKLGNLGFKEKLYPSFIDRKRCIVTVFYGEGDDLIGGEAIQGEF